MSDVTTEDLRRILLDHGRRIIEAIKTEKADVKFQPDEPEKGTRNDPDEDREDLVSLERYDEIVREHMKAERELADKNQSAVWPQRDIWD